MLNTSNHPQKIQPSNPRVLSMRKNPLSYTTYDEKDLVIIIILFTLYFDPHKNYESKVEKYFERTKILTTIIVDSI